MTDRNRSKKSGGTGSKRSESDVGAPGPHARVKEVETKMGDNVDALAASAKTDPVAALVQRYVDAQEALLDAAAAYQDDLAGSVDDPQVQARLEMLEAVKSADPELGHRLQRYIVTLGQLRMLTDVMREGT